MGRAERDGGRRTDGKGWTERGTGGGTEKQLHGHVYVCMNMYVCMYVMYASLACLYTPQTKNQLLSIIRHLDSIESAKCARVGAVEMGHADLTEL